MELEQLAEFGRGGRLPGPGRGAGDDGAPLLVGGRDLVRAVVEDLDSGVPALPPASTTAWPRRPSPPARLSATPPAWRWWPCPGGVFQNLLLLERTVARPVFKGFRVLVHSRVPLTTPASASARPRSRVPERRASTPPDGGPPLGRVTDPG